MKLNILILIIFLLFINGCVNKSQYQIEYEKIKGKAMFEDFDIKMYEENRRNNLRGHINVGHGKKVRQTSSVQDHIDYIEYDRPSLMEEYIEYYPNKKIKRYILSFRNDGFLIQTIEFDENKKITKNIDHEEKYAFKPHELFELIEKDYKEIDLLGKYTYIRRFKIDEKNYPLFLDEIKIHTEQTEYIKIEKDLTVDIYRIKAIDMQKYDPLKASTEVEIIINAQTGEVMLYGSHELLW